MQTPSAELRSRLRRVPASSYQLGRDVVTANKECVQAKEGLPFEQLAIRIETDFDETTHPVSHRTILPVVIARRP